MVQLPFMSKLLQIPENQSPKKVLIGVDLSLNTRDTLLRILRISMIWLLEKLARWTGLKDLLQALLVPCHSE